MNMYILRSTLITGINLHTSIYKYLSTAAVYSVLYQTHYTVHLSIYLNDVSSQRENVYSYTKAVRHADSQTYETCR